MRTSYTPHGIPSRLLVVTVLVCALALGAAGCKEKEPELRSYGEPGGAFHIKVPAVWQTAITPGAITIRASEELPTEERFDTLSFLIMTGVLEEDDLGEKLTTIIDARAEQRAWQEYEIGEVEDAAVGNRIAFKRHVTGTDANGVAFRADYIITRTSGKEFLIVALAPAETWEDDQAAIEELVLNQWFWHVPDPATMIDLQGEEDTATPDGDEAGEDEGVEGEDEGTEDGE